MHALQPARSGLGNNPTTIKKCLQIEWRMDAVCEGGRSEKAGIVERRLRYVGVRQLQMVGPLDANHKHRG